MKTNQNPAIQDLAEKHAREWPSLQEQIDYWNTKERLEHERVMNIRSEIPNQSPQTGRALGGTCSTCGKVNHIVNQCGCDPNNLPTKLPKVEIELLVACRTAVECCERQPTRQEYEHMYVELKTAIEHAESENMLLSGGLTAVQPLAVQARPIADDRSITTPQDDASNPQEQDSDTAQPSTKKEGLTLDQTEATCDYLDEQERKWNLREAGSNDGEGESYPVRNV